MHPTYKIAICAPVHVQPSENWINALKSISYGKHNVRIIITDDSNGKVDLPAEWDVYAYDAQKEEMGEAMYARFERFHKSSCSKNFGHWIAWRDGADVIIGLDSDCIVPPNFIGEHLDGLNTVSYGWTNLLEGTGWFPRGYPYAQRSVRTVASLGMWSKELDLYGKDRVDNPDLQTSDPCVRSEHKVIDGFTTISGMNWACWADAIPGLLFLPNFDYKHGDEPDSPVFKFRRHDDIWGGYIFQKMMAIRNERMVYGFPIVTHETVVDPQKDASDEEGMIYWEKPFYDAVDVLFASVESCMYEDITSSIVTEMHKMWWETEWQPIAEAYMFWNELFSNTQRKV